MKIRVKLLAGYLGVAALCAVVGILGIVQLSKLQKDLGDFADMILPKIEALDTISYNFMVVQAATRSLSNERGIDDDVFYKAQIDSIATARTAYSKAIKDFEAMPMVPDEQKLWQAVKDGITPAKGYNDQVSALFDKARALKAQVAAESAQGAQAAAPARAGQTAQAASGQSAKNQREAIFAEVFALVAGAQSQSMDAILVGIEKLRNWDRQYYGDDMTKAALAQASIALVAVIIITALAIAFAVAIGLILGNSISRGIRTGVAGVARIAAGDLTQKLASRSKDEIGELSASVNTCIDNVAALVSDADMLAKAAVEGKLAARADASKHQGDYRKVVEGVNRTLDAVIGPVSVAAGYMDRIAKGDLPPKITDTYQGDFNKIKDSLNVCIESINALVEDASFLVQAAVEGRLATRADGSRHQGDYRKVVDGVNKTLDLVITPINETVTVLKRLAEGDLTLRMNGDYKGDFDILKTALNDSLESFNDTLRQVNIAVDQVAEGALQVSQASQSLSQGATEQAASLEEITSSVTEIAGQTKLNTENANQVNSLAVTARKNAEQGNEQMGKLVIAMGDINKSAEDIKKITKAIDDIAFQINLLALNANVEAARAGKYGKGFAVVAEEVRNLAVRSANSVKDTTRMVEETIANISRGNALCDLTAKQLAEIVGGAGQVATLAEDVAAAGREQAQGLEQITQGLNQIDQVTQANTAASEESASASEELSSQSQQVKSMLSRFRIKESEAVMNNAEVMAMLRAEMAKQGPARRGALPAAAQAAQAQKAAQPAHRGKPTGITPADVISLDDDNFGKF